MLSNVLDDPEAVSMAVEHIVAAVLNDDSRGSGIISGFLLSCPTRSSRVDLGLNFVVYSITWKLLLRNSSSLPWNALSFF